MANRKTLNTLQDELIANMLDRIKHGEEFVNQKTGKTYRRPCSPQVLTAAIAELRRHGVLLSPKGAADLGEIEENLAEERVDHTTNFPPDLH